MSFYTKFTDYYEAIFPFSRSVADFLTMYAVSSKTCLDVGCGTGHYAGDFAARGCQVTGIDLDASMIAYAEQHYPGVTFHCMDMREVAQLDTSFEFIYCIGNSGAHLPQADFDRFVSDIRKMLLPGGIWILQLMNWDYVLKREIVQFPEIVAGNNLSFNRRYSQISPESVQFETSLVQGTDIIFEEAVPLYPVHSGDVIELHACQGFSLRSHIGSYSQSAFDPDVFSASIFVFSLDTQLSPMSSP